MQQQQYSQQQQIRYQQTTVSHHAQQAWPPTQMEAPRPEFYTTDDGKVLQIYQRSDLFIIRFIYQIRFRRGFCSKASSYTNNKGKVPKIRRA